MVIAKSELQNFARFLASQFHAKPMLRSGDDGELLRAIVANQLLLVLDLEDGYADTWCSSEDMLPEIWSQWCSCQQPQTEAAPGSR